MQVPSLFLVAPGCEARGGTASDRSPVRGGSVRAQQRKLYQVHQQPMSESGMAISIGANAPPINEGDSQRSSTTGNHSQQQRDFGGVVDLKEPALVEMALIRMCRDELDAVNLCIDKSRISDEALCSRLGIDKGHWSRMRKGRAHFPTAKRLALMALAGNWAPLQYELYRTPLIRQLREQWEQEQRAQVARATDESAGQRWYA